MLASKVERATLKVMGKNTSSLMSGAATAKAIGIPLPTLEWMQRHGRVSPVRDGSGRALGFDLETTREAIARHKLKGFKPMTDENTGGLTVVSGPRPDFLTVVQGVTRLENDVTNLRRDAATKDALAEATEALAKLQDENNLFRNVLGQFAKRAGLQIRSYADEATGERVVELVPAKPAPAEDEDDEDKPAANGNAKPPQQGAKSAPPPAAKPIDPPQRPRIRTV